MAQITPTIVGASSDVSVIFSGYDSSIPLCILQGERFIKHDGNLYVIGHRKYTGMTRYRPAVWKSTDEGATWAVLDATNAPDPFVPASPTFPDPLYPFPGNSVAVQNGSKFHLVQERGYLYLTFGGGATNDYEIKIYTFDCETELWSATVLSGPTSSETTAHIGRALLLNAGMRGNELLVLYKETPVTSEATSLLDIYNFESASWTTTGLQIFDGVHSASERLAASFVYDGTYVHFFSRDQTTGPLYHATMDWTNTLSTAVDLLDTLEASWPDPDVIDNSHYVDAPPVVWNGRVYKGSLSDLAATSSSDYEVSIVCWSAPSGEASPTWQAENIHVPGPSATYRVYGPYLFASNGILRCLWKQTSNDIGQTDTVYFCNRIGGTWGTSEQYYSYEDNPPPNATYDVSFYDNFIKAAIGVPDTQNDQGFSILADIWLNEPAPDYESLTAVYLSWSNGAATAVGVRY